MDMGRKLEAVPYFRGAGFHLTQRAWAEAYLRAKCHLDPSNRLATLTLTSQTGHKKLTDRQEHT